MHRLVPNLNQRRGGTMTTEIVTLQLPTSLYDKLQELATEEQSDPVTVITHLVTAAYQPASKSNKMVA